MYRLLLFITILICCPAILRAQTETPLATYHRLNAQNEALHNSHPELGITYGRQMLAIAQELQVDTLVLNAHLILGQALEAIGDFDLALKSYYSILSLSEQKQVCHYKIVSATLIGRVHQIMKNPEKGQEFIYKAKQSAVDCGRYHDTIGLNYEIGFNIASMGDLATGIRILENNLRVAQQLNRKADILFGLDNLANLFSEMGEPQKALIYALQLLNTPEWWPEDYQKMQVYEHLAEIYVALKDWPNAQQYQRLALKYSTEQGMNDWIYECYKLQAAIDEGNGNYKSALDNQRLYMDMKDSVYAAEYEGKMAAMTALYDLESKQKTIELLEKDGLIQSVKIQEQRTLLLVGLLSAIILFLVIRFRNQRKTQKMREAFSQDLMQAQEMERQRISKELHDSVGQNILFVKNRLQRLSPPPDQQLIQSVDGALEEVRTIAKDLYPNQLEAYGLHAAVQILCETVKESSGVFISSDLDGIDSQLNREAKINCYRIIQECISNTLKHAEASAIRITSNLLPGKVELIVQDNGKGFDKSQLERKSTRSFGLINMEERVKMLRGKLDLETTASKGTKFTFSIPV